MQEWLTIIPLEPCAQSKKIGGPQHRCTYILGNYIHQLKHLKGPHKWFMIRLMKQGDQVE